MGDDESGDGDLPAGSIPSVVLAALRDRMHTRRLSAPEDPGYIQVSLGEEPAAVLVARISAYGYEQLRDGDMAVTDIWSDSSDTSLMAVYEVDGFVENIALVRHFRHPDDIPAAYRPPSPFIEFSDMDFPDDEVVRSRFFHEAFTKATDVVRRVLPRGPRTPGPPV
jgi:hypothetical protein